MAFIISEFNDRAAKFDGWTATIEGTVSQNVGVLGTSGYIVTDNSSTNLMLPNGGIPERGSHVEVTGTFCKAVSLDSFEYSVVCRGDGDR